MTELNQLVAFVADTHFDDLPGKVVARTKLTLMDSIGAILTGSQLPEVAALAQQAGRSSGQRSVTLIGQPVKADTLWACIYHGTAGTSLELDEGHAFSRGHPGMHVLPVVLALSEQAGCSGREALTAFVLGYEVAARIGRGTNLRPGTHPHGTWGTPGAAAAAAKLMSHQTADPVEYIGQSIRVGSNLTLAASFQTAYDGALVRNTFAGVSAQLGLQAAHLASCGFTGEHAGPATVFGRILSDSFDPATLNDALGEQYEITRGYFKLHACCRYNHAALDALQYLQEEYSLTVEQVERVEVDSYLQAAQLDDPQPVTTLGALFSVPFAIATTLVNQTSGPSAFGPAALENPITRRLARRVMVREDPSFTALLPDCRPARVAIFLTDGQVLSHIVYHSKGDPAEPISEAELEAKYFNLTQPVIGREQAEQTLELIQQIEMVENIGELMRCLSN